MVACSTRAECARRFVSQLCCDETVVRPLLSANKLSRGASCALTLSTGTVGGSMRHVSEFSWSGMLQCRSCTHGVLFALDYAVLSE